MSQAEAKVKKDRTSEEQQIIDQYLKRKPTGTHGCADCISYKTMRTVSAPGGLRNPCKRCKNASNKVTRGKQKFISRSTKKGTDMNKEKPAKRK